ncbi:MAG: hypothetical protein ACOC4G_10115 [Bacillota bacterium]
MKKNCITLEELENDRKYYLQQIKMIHGFENPAHEDVEEMHMFYHYLKIIDGYINDLKGREI